MYIVVFVKYFVKTHYKFASLTKYRCYWIEICLILLLVMVMYCTSNLSLLPKSFRTSNLKSGINSCTQSRPMKFATKCMAFFAWYWASKIPSRGSCWGHAGVARLILVMLILLNSFFPVGTQGAFSLILFMVVFGFCVFDVACLCAV